jgi:DNA (cytosine-5)-methyltransferase 1
MTRRPRLLDLFSGAGGAAVGYARAGFAITGVDLAPQPRYPFEFLQADALAWLDARVESVVRRFDVIHASPPCQRWTRAQNARGRADEHADLIAPLRVLLIATGLPYVIENVPEAPLRADLTLCGTSFGLRLRGFEVRRHRIFESNVDLGPSPPCRHEVAAMPIFGHSENADFRRRFGIVPLERRRAGLGCEWMSREELREAIPPAFTEWIGGVLQARLAVAA